MEAMDVVRICKNSDVDEKAPIPEEKPKSNLTVRGQVVSLWSIADLARQSLLTGIKIDKMKLNSLRSVNALLQYGCHYQGRGGRRKIAVDIPKMVNHWSEWIVTFSTAHSKANVDEKEFEIDEILAPLLTAPVKQLRQFYKDLTQALKDDDRVPFFVWSMFSAFGEVIIEGAADDEAIIRLKKKLAGEIAEMVEKDVRPDLQKALSGALMWRPKEDLEAIKEDLKAGAKPHVRGRQSCLFLTTKRRGRGQKEHAVML